MVCLISEDRKLAICGGFRGRKYHYFTRKMTAVLFCDSLWYEPNLVKKLKRKKYERIDLFVARAKRVLGFMPLTFRGWWRVVAVPQLKALREDDAGKTVSADTGATGSASSGAGHPGEQGPVHGTSEEAPE